MFSSCILPQFLNYQKLVFIARLNIAVSCSECIGRGINLSSGSYLLTTIGVVVFIGVDIRSTLSFKLGYWQPMQEPLSALNTSS